MESKVNTKIILTTENERKEIGKQLKEIRRKKEVTQEEMAADTGLSEKTIRNMESGSKCVTYDTICVVCSYLIIDPAVFFPPRLLERCNHFTPEILSLLERIENLDEVRRNEFLSFTDAYLNGIKKEKS